MKQELGKYWINSFISVFIFQLICCGGNKKVAPDEQALSGQPPQAEQEPLSENDDRPVMTTIDEQIRDEKEPQEDSDKQGSPSLNLSTKEKPVFETPVISKDKTNGSTFVEDESGTFTDTYVAELSRTIGTGIDGLGAYWETVDGGFRIPEDAPTVINDRVAGDALYYGMEGMCYGMSYLTGYLARNGHFRTNTDKKGIDETNFVLALLGGGLIDLNIDGYRDTSSYSTAMPDEFYYYAGFLQVDKLAPSLTRGDELLRFLEEKLINPLIKGIELPDRNAVVYAQIYHELKAGHLPNLYMGNDENAHAVLVYRIMRFSEMDLVFVYDPNVLYDSAGMHQNILSYDRNTEEFGWDYYSNRGIADRGYFRFHMLAVVH